jgi:glycosyltransferase involved in cell wall biosynthesis
MINSEMKKFTYKRIFAYGSSQFCGHIEEYLATHTAELCMLIVQPRIGQHQNLLRRYSRGVLLEERLLCSSQNIVLYYTLWYFHHVRELLHFSGSKETTMVFGGHPIVFFGMSLLKLIRPLVYTYWIGDYFPSSHPLIRLYERLKKWYHDRIPHTFYLSDAINRVMNGTVMKTPFRRTVMWGLKPYPAMQAPPVSPFNLLFVGLIRPGQGLEKLFGFLKEHSEYRLSLIGVGHAGYVAELHTLLQQTGLADRVFFPNRFYSEPELLEVARRCHVGIALYDTTTENFTHYADPGKVKAYAEMRLPVVMTRISDITFYIEKFNSGIVIDSTDELSNAIEKVRDNYVIYQNGIQQFIDYFDYTNYYQKSFLSFEEIWPCPSPCKAP